VPDKTIKPVKAITSPIRFLILGFSFNHKNAINMPNGTSNCTKRTAEDASIMLRPENVNEYWRVHPIKESINNSFKYFFGIGNHHTRTNPVTLQRKPLMSIGGSCSMPGLVITKPIPHRQGTDIASKKSRIGIKDLFSDSYL
jgi:hypothetical protein